MRRWIRVGQDDTFLKVYQEHDPHGRQGFIDEKLFRCQDQDEAGVTKYVNIACWNSRADFEECFGRETPPQAEYETRQRERVWLTRVEFD